MSGSFCRHPVLAKFTALAAFVCLHVGRQATEEPKKKPCFFFNFLGGFGCFAFRGRSRQKNPGKIGFFGGQPCLKLLLVGVSGWLRS